MSVKCKLCEKVFSKVGNANRHFRETHNEDLQEGFEKVWSYQCLEENCSNIFFPQVKGLIGHLEMQHGLKFETVQISLENMEEFYQWKSSIELSYNCQYTTKNRFRNSSDKETLYLICNRSKASYFPKPIDQRKRAFKHPSSLKLDYSCTSGMKVVINSYGVEVKWQKYHYGHDLEPNEKVIKKIITSRLSKNKLKNITKANLKKNEDCAGVNDHSYAFSKCSNGLEANLTDVQSDAEIVEDVNVKFEFSESENLDNNQRQLFYDETLDENAANANNTFSKNEKNDENLADVKCELSENENLEENSTNKFLENVNFEENVNISNSKNNCPKEDETNIAFQYSDYEMVDDVAETSDFEDNSTNTSYEFSDLAENAGSINSDISQNKEQELVKSNAIIQNDSINSDNEFNELLEEDETDSTTDSSETGEGNKDKEKQVVIHFVWENNRKRAVGNYVESDLEDPEKRHKYWIESQTALNNYEKTKRNLLTTKSQMKYTIERLNNIVKELKKQRS